MTNIDDARHQIGESLDHIAQHLRDLNEVIEPIRADLNSAEGTAIRALIKSYAGSIVAVTDALLAVNGLLNDARHGMGDGPHLALRE